MTHRTSAVALLLAAGLLLFSQAAGAIGSNLTGAGGFASSDTGSRERVSLTAEQGVLTGRPKQSAVKLIAVEAPGHSDSHIVLRDLTSVDGTKTLLLSTPNSLTAATQQVTLFIRHRSNNLLLVQQREGIWRSHRPQLIALPRGVGADMDSDSLLAFRVAGLGLYWLLEDDSPPRYAQVSQPLDSSAVGLMGGGLSRALLPLFWSIVLLALGWAISCLIHWAQRKRG